MIAGITRKFAKLDSTQKENRIQIIMEKKPGSSSLSSDISVVNAPDGT